MIGLGARYEWLLGTRYLRARHGDSHALSISLLSL